MLSERIRQAAAADDEERDRDGAPAAGEGPGTNGSRVGSCRCSHGAPRRREIYCRIGICRGWPSGDSNDSASSRGSTSLSTGYHLTSDNCCFCRPLGHTPAGDSPPAFVRPPNDALGPRGAAAVAPCIPSVTAAVLASRGLGVIAHRGSALLEGSTVWSPHRRFEHSPLPNSVLRSSFRRCQRPPGVFRESVRPALGAHHHGPDGARPTPAPRRLPPLVNARGATRCAELARQGALRTRRVCGACRQHVRAPRAVSALLGRITAPKMRSRLHQHPSQVPIPGLRDRSCRRREPLERLSAIGQESHCARRG